MTVLYPKLCFNEVCYIGTALRDSFPLETLFKVTTHSNNRNSKSSREVILGSVRL